MESNIEEVVKFVLSKIDLVNFINGFNICINNVNMYVLWTDLDFDDYLDLTFYSSKKNVFHVKIKINNLYYYTICDSNFILQYLNKYTKVKLMFNSYDYIHLIDFINKFTNIDTIIINDTTQTNNLENRYYKWIDMLNIHNIKFSKYSSPDNFKHIYQYGKSIKNIIVDEEMYTYEYDDEDEKNYTQHLTNEEIFFIKN